MLEIGDASFLFFFARVRSTLIRNGYKGLSVPCAKKAMEQVPGAEGRRFKSPRARYGDFVF